MRLYWALVLVDYRRFDLEWHCKTGVSSRRVLNLSKVRLCFRVVLIQTPALLRPTLW